MNIMLRAVVATGLLAGCAFGQLREAPIHAHVPHTMTFTGPQVSEAGEFNPFRDVRLDVTFYNVAGAGITVPGYFATDGEAHTTGAAAGNVWRLHFVPPQRGTWKYRVSFRKGEDIAVSDHPLPGEPLEGDGKEGQIVVGPPPDGAASRGMLLYLGERYLQFAATGERFLKSGTDSPENFLAYEGFDGTSSMEARTARDGEAFTKKLHTYAPHIKDAPPGTPDKFRGIIGAIEYLHGRGVNSIYMVTMNVEGDGKDVWPWIAPEVRDRFDVSKLAQWGRVFDYMTQRGMMLHLVLTETENESLFEHYDPRKGDFADTRKLYYREMVARFAHHPMLIWNIGEENGGDGRPRPDGSVDPSAKGNTDAQRKAFAAYIHQLDPYDHPIVVHTYPNQYDKVYKPLLDSPHFAGVSLQMGDMKRTHSETLKWIERSTVLDRVWTVWLDEIGPAHTGVKPDADDPEHDEVRHHALWGNLMAGGSGCEWYFGYKFPHNDLNLEAFRSRENMFDQTRHAVNFFQDHLPFWEMHSADELTAAKEDYVLAKEGQVYAIYLPPGAGAGAAANVQPKLKLPEGEYGVQWFNPRAGGALEDGSVKQVSGGGGGEVDLGAPPHDPHRDWVVLVRRK